MNTAHLTPTAARWLGYPVGNLPEGKAQKHYCVDVKKSVSAPVAKPQREWQGRGTTRANPHILAFETSKGGQRKRVTKNTLAMFADFDEMLRRLPKNDRFSSSDAYFLVLKKPLAGKKFNTQEAFRRWFSTCMRYAINTQKAVDITPESPTRTQTGMPKYYKKVNE